MTHNIETLGALYAAFSDLNMEGGWHRKHPALWSEPRKSFEPHQWRYKDVKPILTAAGELIGTDQAERRNLTMFNPTSGNIYPTVNTIVAAYQMIKPGETARSHRHTPNALRLILEGRGTVTVVDGKRVEMRPGDVLLTPNWSWHSHENQGPDDCYWMDFLDVPLVHLLEPMFFERHPNELESDITDLENTPLAFRWEATQDRLSAQPTGASNEADASVELGGPALPSIGLHMQKLASGNSSACLQTTANSIFAIVSGEGQTVIDGHTFNWTFGDTVCVPAWREYRHIANSDAVMLRVTDAPLFHKLGWLKQRTL